MYFMHLRNRHIQKIISKRSKVFPVVGLIGPRQVGKTTFLMRQWKDKLKAHYVTLDKHEVVSRAKRAPESFLLSESQDLTKKLIIDEAQKAPSLFDSMKSLIDEKRRIGIFTVSGSVEFSDKSGVRESLAGRIGICRLYPLTLSEMHQQTLITPWVDGSRRRSLKRTDREVNDWLTKGGIPIFCALHDEAERNMAIENWLEAICYRDLQQIKGGRLDGDIAMSILRYIAREPRPVVSQLSNDTGVSRTTIAKYLLALEALFLIYKIPSLENRRAIPAYALFDSAVIRYLLGHGDDSFIQHQTLKTMIINEILAQHEYSGKRRPGLFSYRSRGGSGIDLVVQSEKKLLGIEISIKSDINPYSLRSMKSFLARHAEAKGIVVAPVTQGYHVDGIEVRPWTHTG